MLGLEQILSVLFSDWTPTSKQPKLDGFRYSNVLMTKTALCEIYGKAGNANRIFDGYNTILPPTALRVELDCLIFAEECQSVLLWGVEKECSSSEPEVFQVFPVSGEKHMEDLKLRETLVGLILFNAFAKGCFNQVTHQDASEETLPFTTEDAGLIGGFSGLRFYLADRTLLIHGDIGNGAEVISCRKGSLGV